MHYRVNVSVASIRGRVPTSLTDRVNDILITRRGDQSSEIPPSYYCSVTSYTKILESLLKTGRGWLIEGCNILNDLYLPNTYTKKMSLKFV